MRLYIDVLLYLYFTTLLFVIDLGLYFGIQFPLHSNPHSKKSALLSALHLNYDFSIHKIQVTSHNVENLNT
jgi:hypothetical protein